MPYEVITFTKEELVDFYNYIERAANVRTFYILNHILDTAEVEEAPEKFEELENDFREDLYRLKNNISKKAYETAREIEMAKWLRNATEMLKNRESED